MKKIILIGVGGFLIGLAGVFGYMKYRESQKQKQNFEYQNRLYRQLALAKTTKDSLEILKQENQLINLPPQKEYLAESTKSFIRNTYKDLRQREKDRKAWSRAKDQNTIEAYTDYLINNPTGRYRGHAKNAILSIQNRAKIDDNRSPDNRIDDQQDKTVNTRVSELRFLRLICVKQLEFAGSDRITLNINDKKYLNEHRMKTGDQVSLSKLPVVSLDKDSYVSVSVVEIDPLLNDLVLDLTISGNRYRPKVYEKEGGPILGGKYKLVYELK